MHIWIVNLIGFRCCAKERIKGPRKKAVKPPEPLNRLPFQFSLCTPLHVCKCMQQTDLADCTLNALCTQRTVDCIVLFMAWGGHLPTISSTPPIHHFNQIQMRCKTTHRLYSNKLTVRFQSNRRQFQSSFRFS